MKHDMNSPAKQKAIFLDRDGVINVYKDYILSPDQFELAPTVVEGLRRINHSPYLAVVITNQSHIARGYCTVEMVDSIHVYMRNLLAQQGVRIDALYYCPHHPNPKDSTRQARYIKDCECRKPKPGMIFDAARDLNIDLGASYFVGDSKKDIEAGVAAGTKTIFLDRERIFSTNPAAFRPHPDFIVHTFAGAVEAIFSV